MTSYSYMSMYNVFLPQQPIAVASCKLSLVVEHSTVENLFPHALTNYLSSAFSSVILRLYKAQKLSSQRLLLTVFAFVIAFFLTIDTCLVIWYVCVSGRRQQNVSRCGQFWPWKQYKDLGGDERRRYGVLPSAAFARFRCKSIQWFPKGGNCFVYFDLLFVAYHSICVLQSQCCLLMLSSSWCIDASFQPAFVLAASNITKADGCFWLTVFRSFILETFRIFFMFLTFNVKRYVVAETMLVFFACEVNYGVFCGVNNHSSVTVYCVSNAAQRLADRGDTTRMLVTCVVSSVHSAARYSEHCSMAVTEILSDHLHVSTSCISAHSPVATCYCLYWCWDYTAPLRSL